MSGKIDVLAYDSAAPSSVRHGQEQAYVLGHAPKEIDRLIAQAQIIGPVTERMLRAAGMAPGMRVLDLGCGAGDVSMLAAKLVGASGSVVGIDRSPDALATARRRAQEAGIHNASFVEAAVETFFTDQPFDFVVGRYVLIHQNDVEGFLRAAARLARHGGTMAFHEVSFTEEQKSYPPVWAWEMTFRLTVLAFREALVHWQVSENLVAEFQNAGLPVPNLFCELPIGGGEASPIYPWMVHTLRSMQPGLTGMGLLSGEVLHVDKLVERIRKDAVAARSQVMGPRQVCAWVQLPS